MNALQALGKASLLVALAASCGTDGHTPSCGDYPKPYDVRVPSRRAEEWPRLVEPASDPHNCTTLPAGFAPGGGGTESGGSGGSGGLGAAGGGGDTDVMAGSSGAGGEP